MSVDTQQSSPQSEEPWTVRRVIDWTTAHLTKHGSDSPRLDTEILLAHARNCARIDLYTRYDEVLSDTQRQTMRELVLRRAKAEPVAYLVGHREFFGLEFQVTSDVLIPRPDTETLLVELLERAKEIDEPRILDVGTGSGCVAISAAVNKPGAQLTAIDVSSAALDVARRNAADHQAVDRLRLLEGDLFSPLDDGETFHIIASNPPYIPDAEIEKLSDDVRVHEPRLALSGGSDGLDCLRRIIENAPTYLAPSGHLLVEISPEQAEAVCDLFRSQGSLTDIGVVKDLAGRARVVHGRKIAADC